MEVYTIIIVKISFSMVGFKSKTTELRQEEIILKWN